MATGTTDYIVYTVLITIAIVFIWWKFSEPLKKFGGLIRDIFASGADKTVETVQSSKEIVYDI